MSWPLAFSMLADGTWTDGFCHLRWFSSHWSLFKCFIYKRYVWCSLVICSGDMSWLTAETAAVTTVICLHFYSMFTLLFSSSSWGKHLVPVAAECSSRSSLTVWTKEACWAETFELIQDLFDFVFKMFFIILIEAASRFYLQFRCFCCWNHQSTDDNILWNTFCLQTTFNSTSNVI